MATKFETNKAMRFGAVMLVLALLTTCAISGTFAKYTTSSSGTDSARVAKWGIGTSSIVLDDLFQKTYDVDAASGSETVKSDVDVIAPGTTNSVTFNITADGSTAPEVDYTFKVTTEGSSCADDIKNNTNIKWYLDDTTTALTWDKLMEKIATLGSNATIKAGNFPGTAGTAATHTIKWEWVFNTADAADVADTKMGNATTLANTTIKINFVATQVD